MRPLVEVRPTPEQLAIISRNRPGTELIRGAAGSGKTTTAFLSLRSLAGMFASRRLRQADSSPIRILALTYNRTLRG
jgi:DNA helicase IV